MKYYELRNTLREWFRERASLNPLLSPLPLVVPGETSSYGTEVLYLRFSIQTGVADIMGVGSGTRFSRRIGRCFIEVFGPQGEGDGTVSELSTEVEEIWRPAMDSANAPHKLITVGEPFTFERPEDDRYCQVVSVPVQIDHFA